MSGKRRVVYEDQWHKEVAVALSQLREFGAIQDARLKWEIITAPLCGKLAGSSNDFGGVAWDIGEAAPSPRAALALAKGEGQP